MRDLSGKVYYGLHFQPGVAEYKDILDDQGKPLMIYINSNTAKKMDATFPGKPVFVRHKNDITEEDFQQADGYVVESFFNKADGNHWAKFIVTTEEGDRAISNGWKLSNAYFRLKETGSGRWHGVDYSKEVTEGRYEHLAIVNDPRYEDSKVLTPEEFKQYNSEKEAELFKLANSKKNKKNKGEGMFKFLKREKVENSADLEVMDVTLPKSGRTVQLKQVLQEKDEAIMNEDEEQMANMGDMVEVGDEKMSVKNLLNKYRNMCKKKAKNEEEEKEENTDDKEDSMENKSKNEEEEKSENMGEEDEKKSENEEEEEKAENKSKNSNFEDLQNAEKVANSDPAPVLDFDRVARGKKRYGS